MIKELSWYIEDNRFSELVSSIDEKVENLRVSRSCKKDAFAEKQELYELLGFCMKKADYRIDGTLGHFIDGVIFSGNEVNYTALGDFERNLVSKLMYQKHLWEYMGTYSLYSHVSCNAMKKAGYDYRKFLPCEYKEKFTDKSPISNILHDDERFVPVYVYPDGSVSSKYFRDFSRLSFSELKDRSGFDWNRIGWDPDYNVDRRVQMQKVGRIGERNDDGKRNRFSFYLVKTGGSAVLSDPHCLFLLSMLLLKSDKSEESRSRYAFFTDSLKKCLDKMNVKKIAGISSALLTGAEFSGPVFEVLRSEGGVISLFKSVLGDFLDDKVRFFSQSDIRLYQKSVSAKMSSVILSLAENILSAKKKFIESLGNTSSDSLKFLFENRIYMPYDFRDESDCRKARISDEDRKYLQSLQIPQDKIHDFNRILFNLLNDFDLIESGGITRRQLIEYVYESAVNGAKISRNIVLEIPFRILCRRKGYVFAPKQKDDEIISKYEMYFSRISRDLGSSQQFEFRNMLENVIDCSKFINDSLGFNEEDSFDLAYDIFKADNKIMNVGVSYGSSYKKDYSQVLVNIPVSVREIIERASFEAEVKRLKHFLLGPDALKSGGKNETAEFTALVENEKNSIMSGVLRQNGFRKKMSSELVFEFGEDFDSRNIMFSGFECNDIVSYACEMLRQIVSSYVSFNREADDIFYSSALKKINSAISGLTLASDARDVVSHALPAYKASEINEAVFTIRNAALGVSADIAQTAIVKSGEVSAAKMKEKKRVRVDFSGKSDGFDSHSEDSPFSLWDNEAESLTFNENSVKIQDEYAVNAVEEAADDESSKMERISRHYLEDKKEIGSSDGFFNRR